MGNIVNKEITKDDTDDPAFIGCFDYIVKTLVEEHNYKLHICTHWSEVIDAILDNKIIKIGDLYLFLIKNFDRDSMFIRYLITPFSEGLCESESVNKNYSLTSILESEYLFVAGFSHVNFCKIIAICGAGYSHVHQKPMLNLICALKTDVNVLDHEKDNIKEVVRVNLGMIITFKAIQYFKENGHKIILLECNYKLFFYYNEKLLFKVGTGPDNTYQMRRTEFLTAKLAALHNTNMFERSSHKAPFLIYDSFDEKLAVQNKEEAFKDTLFTMYFDVDRYFKRLRRSVSDRIYDVSKHFMLKNLFDSLKDSYPTRINDYFDKLMGYHDFDE